VIDDPDHAVGTDGIHIEQVSFRCLRDAYEGVGHLEGAAFLRGGVVASEQLREPLVRKVVDGEHLLGLREAVNVVIGGMIEAARAAARGETSRKQPPHGVVGSAPQHPSARYDGHGNPPYTGSRVFQRAVQPVAVEEQPHEDADVKVGRRANRYAADQLREITGNAAVRLLKNGVVIDNSVATGDRRPATGDPFYSKSFSAHP
jgi:hypothetical protein